MATPSQPHPQPTPAEVQAFAAWKATLLAFNLAQKALNEADLAEQSARGAMIAAITLVQPK
jgi:hypothetical protein